MKIVLASGNQGKLRELQRMLADSALPIACEVVPQADFYIGEVEETGDSFEQNALIKARHASIASGLPAIADDSGLSVAALEGEPGVYSARYAGRDASSEQNIAKLLKQMEKVPLGERGAEFHCVIAMVTGGGDRKPLICHGSWRGEIAESPVGEGGFGYDSVFFVSEFGCTAAQLSADEKNRVSHRAVAMKTLMELLRTRL